MSDPCCSVFLGTVGCAGVASLSLLHIFSSIKEKMWPCPIEKVSYVKFKVYVEIANICFELLCLSRNVGCARVACLFRLHFCFFSFSKKWWVFPCKRFHMSCLRLLLRLLTFVLCCSFFQKTVVALVSLREGSFIFFFAVWLVMFFCHLTMLLLCVSFFGSYALWLIFNTAIKFILKAAFVDDGWRTSQ